MPAAREMELLCKGQPTSVPQAPRDYSHWFVSWEFCSAWDSLFFQSFSPSSRKPSYLLMCTGIPLPSRLPLPLEFVPFSFS